MPSCRRPPREVGDCGVLGHVQRILVAHVDDGRADLDALGLRADRGQERERRGELRGEMVHANVCAVDTEFLGGDREVDRLEQGIRCRSLLRAGNGLPVTEGEESDALHHMFSL